MDVLPAGHVIGSYRIVRVAGRGAVGVVYVAEHTFTGRTVALKTLSRVYAGESEFRARFDREAEGAATVDHPNITTVYEAGEQDGLPYLVMTFVDGPDLERVIEHEGGPILPELTVRVCGDVALALDAAAATGFAHRDVKPANILLEGYTPGSWTPPTKVYLSDFGLTKHNAAATVTRTGQFVGTLLYMSPEQIEGNAVAASDQYSLACVLYECLAGTPPFVPSGGSNLSLLTAHLTDPVPSISERSNGRYSPRLDRVIETALAKRAQDRYPSCTAFVAAAADVLGIDPPMNDPAHAPAASAAPSTAAATARPVTGPSPAPAQSPLAPTPPPHPIPPVPLGGHPVATGFTSGHPSGLPGGLPPAAYQAQGPESGGRTWLVIGIAVAIAIAVAVVLLLLRA